MNFQTFFRNPRKRGKSHNHSAVQIGRLSYFENVNVDRMDKVLLLLLFVFVWIGGFCLFVSVLPYMHSSSLILHFMNEIWICKIMKKPLVPICTPELHLEKALISVLSGLLIFCCCCSRT